MGDEAKISSTSTFAELSYGQQQDFIRSYVMLKKYVLIFGYLKYYKGCMKVHHCTLSMTIEVGKSNTEMIETN